jgi:hypothetical protein
MSHDPKGYGDGLENLPEIKDKALRFDLLKEQVNKLINQGYADHSPKCRIMIFADERRACTCGFNIILGSINGLTL